MKVFLASILFLALIGCSQGSNKDFGYKWLEDDNIKGFDYGPSNVFLDFHDSYVLNFKKAKGYIVTEVITREIAYYDFDPDIRFKGDTILVSYKRRYIRVGDHGTVDVINFWYRIKADSAKRYVLKFIYPQGYP